MKLHPDIIQGIKSDLTAALFSEKEIARRNRCSHGAVQYYKRGGMEHKTRKRYSYERLSPKRECVVAGPRPMPAPNALPWVTKEMLTGARAPIAKVRS